ncbi:hypothetical protein [Dongia sp.]|uniref:hypothetical protein n=1 Tax=Dongia sp. TaxID=1977262 RepID=UPI0035B470A1
MPRKTKGPKGPRSDQKLPDAPPMNGKKSAEIVSLTASPAFEQWLDRQTKKLVEASTTEADSALVELIRSWPGKNPRKTPGKITD